MEMLLFVLRLGCCWNKRSTHFPIQSENQGTELGSWWGWPCREMQTVRVPVRGRKGPRDVQNTGLWGSGVWVTATRAWRSSESEAERQGADIPSTGADCGTHTAHPSSLEFTNPRGRAKLNWRRVPSTELTWFGGQNDLEPGPCFSFYSLAPLCCTQPTWPSAGPGDTEHSGMEVRLWAGSL